MKPYIIIIFVAVSFMKINAQNAVNNMQKYVYYKQRFLNNFIAVGNGKGESLPLDIRRISTSKIINGPYIHEFAIGDATVRLGWYIAVLATEYKLLNDQGLDTYQTRKELYYALEAFNRLDLNAESYFNLAGTNNPNQTINPPSSDLNGFFIRDDMTDNFIDSTYLVEDYNRVIGSSNYQNFTSSNTTGHPHLKTSPQSNIYMSGVRGEFNQYQRTPLTDDAHPYKDEMSQDQIYDLFLGLALVKKCVDPAANFNGLPLADGSVSLLQEAINITNRIINRVVEDDFILKNQSTHFQGQCTVTPNECENDFTAWGCEHNCVVGDGSNMRLLGYGAVKAASYITGRSVADIYGAQYWRMPTQQAMWNLMGSVEAIAAYEAIDLISGKDDAKHEYKFMTALAAVGGEWENANFYSVFNLQDIITDMYNNPNLVIDPDYYLVEALGTINVGFTINLVEPRMRFFTNNFAFNEIEYLIYCFLHDDSPNWTGANTIDFEALMDEAPCMGPYYYETTVYNNGNTFPPYESLNWSTSSRWKNGYNLNNHPAGNPDHGEYSGLDYMLLFNMYCLLKPNYASYNFNSNNIVIPSSSQFPMMSIFNSGPIFLGSNFSPGVNVVFESISSAGTIDYINSNLYGHITYKAGKQIHLTNGFKVKRGAKFHAVTEPITCDIYGQYRSSNDVLNWENGGNDNPVPLSNKITKNNIIASNKPINTAKNINSIKMPTSIGINVYPNPSDGIFNIDAGKENLICKIELFDMLGTKLEEQVLNKNLFEYNISKYSKGSYILKTTDQYSKVTRNKIVLN